MKGEGKLIATVFIKIIGIFNVEQISNFFLGKIAIFVFLGKIYLIDLLKLSGRTLTVIALNHQIFILIDDGKVAN